MVTERGSEGRASWPFSDGIFFGEKWDSLRLQLLLEDSALTQLGSGRCLRFRMGTSRQPSNSWVQPYSHSPQWLMLHSFVKQDTQIHDPLCLLCKKWMSHTTHRLSKPLGCWLICRVYLSLLWKCLIFLRAETNPIIIAIINWKRGALVPRVCAANLWRQPPCFSTLSLAC